MMMMILIVIVLVVILMIRHACKHAHTHTHTHTHTCAPPRTMCFDGVARMGFAAAGVCELATTSPENMTCGKGREACRK